MTRTVGSSRVRPTGKGWTRFSPIVRKIPDAAYMRAIAEQLYGASTFARAEFSRAYDAYHARVAKHFVGREDDLLILDLFSGGGWPELCAFLGRPMPAGAFPVENRGRDTIREVDPDGSG